MMRGHRGERPLPSIATPGAL